MTPTEAILWEILRNRKFKGLKFRRQMNIGPYIVDFLCKEYKVALEIDGGIHDEEDQKEHDLSRTIFLNELDYQILRIKNEDIYNNLQFTLEDIYTFIKNQETKQSPLLRKGEGEGEVGSLYISKLSNPSSLLSTITGASSSPSFDLDSSFSFSTTCR